MLMPKGSQEIQGCIFITLSFTLPLTHCKLREAEPFYFADTEIEALADSESNETIIHIEMTSAPSLHPHCFPIKFYCLLCKMAGKEAETS